MGFSSQSKKVPLAFLIEHPPKDQKSRIPRIVQRRLDTIAEGLEYVNKAIAKGEIDIEDLAWEEELGGDDQERGSDR